MTSPALLVTVHGPRASGDFAALADVPTARLAGALAHELGETADDEGGGARDADGRWRLAPAGGAAFDPGMTLAELAVVDGAVLELRLSDARS